MGAAYANEIEHGVEDRPIVEMEVAAGGGKARYVVATEVGESEYFSVSLSQLKVQGWKCIPFLGELIKVWVGTGCG